LPRVALLVEYSGKRLHGSQYQIGVRTVQSELECALSAYLRSETRVLLSGRTDTGVHAVGQVAHLDIGVATEAADLDIWRLCWALNGILARDICVRAAQIVPDDFHARFSATRREYVYRLLNRPQRSALLEDDHHFIPRTLDLQAMQQAASQLIGSHDFASFRSTNANRSTTICRVSRAELLNKGEGKLEFWIAADHFVYNMVRIIVGTLIEIGLNKKAPESFVKALAESDRNLAGPTAPPWGLTLYSIEYPDHYKLFEEAH
jgi:tRNA pseudouridine38-40 synthase